MLIASSDLQQAEADEPGSFEYNYQAWRQQRNEQIIPETRSHAEIAGQNHFFADLNSISHLAFLYSDGRRWDRPVTMLHVSGSPLSIAFHAYDPHLVIANETDTVQ